MEVSDRRNPNQKLSHENASGDGVTSPENTTRDPPKFDRQHVRQQQMSLSMHPNGRGDVYKHWRSVHVLHLFTAGIWPTLLDPCLIFLEKTLSCGLLVDPPPQSNPHVTCAHGEGDPGEVCWELDGTSSPTVRFGHLPPKPSHGVPSLKGHDLDPQTPIFTKPGGQSAGEALCFVGPGIWGGILPHESGSIQTGEPVQNQSGSNW